MQRHEPGRSLSWPSHLNGASAHRPSTYRCLSEPKSATAPPTKLFTTSFEEDLENNPGNYFLSPLEMYEDWDDSDSDGEEVEWNAGIMDFALFDEDRRKAQKNEQSLPSKWSGMLANQADALKRSVQRSRNERESELAKTSPHTSDKEVPGLTPDASPDLRDDLDVDSFHGQTALHPKIPHYLTLTVTPPGEAKGKATEERDGLLLPMYENAQQRPRIQGDRKLQRPGMRHTRTMSGRSHSWRRPGREMYSVREEAEAEEKAEERSEGRQDAGRGRR
ncbi:uncharacterized protein LTR77_005154 [Saxophila tyrrhenica]|uniref:Uncharacterized protein n=1 Tax=Saxophila tyrrhenica TaxID=1690608 RepID=A0AAV9PC27_9PEZI|nr:hypothetical protein LTR77_005154 [Saxophila tyrrhenica]